jgi:putative ABC transport system permease protein
MSYLEIPLSRLSIAIGFIALSMLLSRWKRLDLERDLAWGALRGAVQLLAIGHVLLLLFQNERPLWVILALSVMLGVAAATSARRVEHGPPARSLFPYALAAIAAGSAAALVPVFAFVLPLHPSYEARYLVPISGMMIASAMNVVAQVFERIFAAAHAHADEIELLLALGATPQQALARHVRATVRAAMIPTINGLLTVGLVALPGMMTGQILSGTAPEQAVRYQIVILYQLVAVAAVSGVIAVGFARRLLFTPRAQLRVLSRAPVAAAGRPSPGARRRSSPADRS